MSSEPGSTSEIPLPVFWDEGRYTVIDPTEAHAIESGTYSSDTRLIPSRDMGSKKPTWATCVSTIPDGQMINSDTEDTIPNITTEGGEAWYLSTLERDPQGVQAEFIHKQIVTLLQRGISARELYQTITNLIDQVKELGIDGYRKRLADGLK